MLQIKTILFAKIRVNYSPYCYLFQMLKLFFVQAFLRRLFWHHHWNPTALQIGRFFDRTVTIKVKYTYILLVVDQLQRKLELQHLTLLRKNLHFQLLLSVGKQAYYSRAYQGKSANFAKHDDFSFTAARIWEVMWESKTFHIRWWCVRNVEKGNLSGSLACLYYVRTSAKIFPSTRITR